MSRIAKAGLAYWAVIFALGFVLGTVRTLWGAEALGEANFILIEVPVMLLASFAAAHWLTRRFDIASTGAALGMGALAFALLMAAEVALSTALGLSVSLWISGLLSPPGLYGFLGQIAFGLMPVLARPREG